MWGDGAVHHPPIWLAGFSAIHADADEETEILISLEERAFQYWDQDSHAWRTDPGKYRVLLGTSVGDTQEIGTVVR